MKLAYAITAAVLLGLLTWAGCIIVDLKTALEIKPVAIYIEKPALQVVEKTVPITLLDIRYVDVPGDTVYVDRVVKEIVKETIEVYPPDDTGYFEWESIAEIKDYVKSTGIPDREYIKGVYDCDNFALDLVEQADRDNRPIWMLGIYKYKADGTITYHWKCLTVKALDTYEIEPQTGNTWILQGFELARVDY